MTINTHVPQQWSADALNQWLRAELTKEREAIRQLTVKGLTASLEKREANNKLAETLATKFGEFAENVNRQVEEAYAKQVEAAAEAFNQHVATVNENTRSFDADIKALREKVAALETDLLALKKPASTDDGIVQW